jgi:hypothetical protein
MKKLIMVQESSKGSNFTHNGRSVACPYLPELMSHLDTILTLQIYCQSIAGKSGCCHDIHCNVFRLMRENTKINPEVYP